MGIECFIRTQNMLAEEEQQMQKLKGLIQNHIAKYTAKEGLAFKEA